MPLDDRLRSLIAVGASVSANCQPCLRRTVEMAIGQGADELQVAEAIEIGKRVRRGAGAKLDELVGELLTGRVSGPIKDSGCGCRIQADSPG